MNIERFWMFIAVAGVLLGGVFLWRNNMSAAFVTATLGAVSWFLSYRAQIRAKIATSEGDLSDSEADENSNEK
jgi:hypothetical protein